MSVKRRPLDSHFARKRKRIVQTSSFILINAQCHSRHFWRSFKCKSNYGCKAESKDEPEDEQFQSSLSGKHVEAIVVDLSQVQYIDEVGVETIKEVKKEYEKENVKLMLTHCNGKCWSTLHAIPQRNLGSIFIPRSVDEIIEFLKAMQSYSGNLEEIIYLTNHDACVGANAALT